MTVAAHSCGARWTGASRAHCAACHRTFNSTYAFDFHRRSLTCRDPEDIGMVGVPHKLGETIWQSPGSWQPDDDERDDAGEGQ